MTEEIEIMESCKDDYPEQNPVCVVCHNRKATVHLKHLNIEVCDYCHDDFNRCD